MVSLALRPPAPLDVHEQRRAERARNESQRKDGERVQNARQRIRKREEQRRKYQHRSQAVDEEIEVLGRSPNDDADGDIAGCDIGMA